MQGSSHLGIAAEVPLAIGRCYSGTDLRFQKVPISGVLKKSELTGHPGSGASHIADSLMGEPVIVVR